MAAGLVVVQVPQLDPPDPSKQLCPIVVEELPGCEVPPGPGCIGSLSPLATILSRVFHVFGFLKYYYNRLGLNSARGV